MVDRYNAYNRLPLRIQYCYAHLLRDLEKLGKDFTDEAEVQLFTGILIPLLSQAMHLTSQDMPDTAYYRKAAQLKKAIMKACRSPARHLGDPGIPGHLYHSHGPALPLGPPTGGSPPTTIAPRGSLRPTVIARKVSFGSSSDAGAETRSILMSVLHTLNKRRGRKSLESVFKGSPRQNRGKSFCRYCRAPYFRVKSRLDGRLRENCL